MKKFEQITLKELSEISLKFNLPDALISVEICSNELKEISIKLLDQNHSELSRIRITPLMEINIEGDYPINREKVEQIIKSVLK